VTAAVRSLAPGAQSSVAGGALRPSASRARLGAAPLFM